jgi:outer membrane protein OmpA-like peptidoglycan-associated protein/uncharacterized protein YegL
MRVTDSAGNDVRGLTVRNVGVRESGSAVRVTRVTPLGETDYLTKKVVLVLDNSNSMEKSREALLRSLQAFLDTLGPGAEIATVMFEEETARLKLEPVTVAGRDLYLDALDFTSDYAKVMEHAKVWFNSRMTNRTYLRDAVLYGLLKLKEVPIYMHKSLVIMSDGEDVGSQFTLEQLLESYVDDVHVYMVDYGRTKDQIETLKRIKEKTGGELYVATQPGDLERFFGVISRTISTIYLVEYKSGQSVESHILNAVFFDNNSSQIRPHYRLYPDHRGALTFDETGFTKPMDTYYNILNIVGIRLQQYPNATLTLTGCNSDHGDEKGNRSLSRKRAETVKQYLTTVWRIAPARISIEERDLPAKPSASATEAGREENRRVEITSNTPAVLKPVLTNRAVGEVSEAGVMAEVYSLQLFDFNSASVSSANEAMLGQVVTSYKGVKGGKIKSVGFTDNIGDAAYNTKLATDRARNVYNILAKMGVPKKSMSYGGLGPKDPQYDNSTPEGRFFNRTVRVVLTYPKM